MLKENLLDFTIEMSFKNFILFFNKMIPNIKLKNYYEIF